MVDFKSPIFTGFKTKKPTKNKWIGFLALIGTGKRNTGKYKNGRIHSCFYRA
jgi:hypothetical protein